MSDTTKSPTTVTLDLSAVGLSPEKFVDDLMGGLGGEQYEGLAQQARDQLHVSPPGYEEGLYQVLTGGYTFAWWWDGKCWYSDADYRCPAGMTVEGGNAVARWRRIVGGLGSLK